MPLGNPNAYGQTVIDPRAELLLGRAMRPEPIQSGVGLLGRLAALGVGLQGQRRFEDEIAASRLQFAQGLSAAGADPSARLAMLVQGTNSRDPIVRQTSMSLMASQIESMRPKSQIVSTPGGGQAAITTQDGKVIGPPQQLIEGRAPAPGITQVPQGENTLSLMWDAKTEQYVPIAEGPRATLDRGMTPGAAQQRMAISAAGAPNVNVLNPSGPAAAIASVDQLVSQGLLDAETGARVRKGLVAEAAQTPEQAREGQVRGETEKRQAIRGELEARARSATEAVRQFVNQAGGMAALSPAQRDAYNALAGAAANAIAQAQGTPGAEPNQDAINRALGMFPGLTARAAGLDTDAVFDRILQSVGAPAPSTKPLGDMSDAELLEEARRLGVAK